MEDFDALLKRGFAEAHEPADDGFSVNVSSAVARHERAAKLRAAVQTSGLGLAAAVTLFGVYGLLQSFGPDMLASAGLGFVHAKAVLGAPVENAVQGLGASLTEVLFATAAVAGGLVAYRSAQE